MRAAVAEAEHDVVAADQFGDGVQRAVAEVGQRDQQHGVAVVVEEAVVGLLERADVRGPARGLPMLIRTRRARSSADRRAGTSSSHAWAANISGWPVDCRLVGQNAFAHFGFAHLGDALGQRQVGDLPVARIHHERVAGQLEADAPARWAAGRSAR